MRALKFARFRPIFLAWLSLIMLLAACVPVQPETTQPVPTGGGAQTATPKFAVSPFCEDVTRDRELAERLLKKVNIEDAMVYDMIIVGPTSLVKEVLSRLLDVGQSNDLELVAETYALSDERALYAPNGESIGRLPSFFNPDKELGQSFANQTLARIRSARDEPLSQKARQFLREQLYLPGLREQGLSAAPNLLLSVKASTNHSGSGSPFDGPPHAFSGSYEDFRSQYAFSDMGIPTPISDQGQGVTIFILDSWPNVASARPEGMPADAYVVLNETPDLGGVNFPVEVYAPPLQQESITPLTGGEVHGLFIAGLAHTVAPEATIQVHRVLNDAGEAHLSDLVKALAAVEASLIAATKPAVINLSLGLSCLEVAADSVDAAAAAGIAEDMAALDDLHTKLLTILANQQVVVSAAAGNNSFPSVEHFVYSMAQCPLTAAGMGSGLDYPACLENVISVGASTQNPSAACYSNGGLNPDLFAFAGDGVEAINASCILVCTARHDNCTDNHCLYGVLGLSQSPEMFGFWSGTSFATPLVSGAAAVLLGRNMAHDKVSPCLVESARTTGGLHLLALDRALAPPPEATSCR